MPKSRLPRLAARPWQSKTGGARGASGEKGRIFPGSSMRRALVFSLLFACSNSPTRTPVRAASSSALSVESCNTLGQTDGARTCSLYDMSKKSFVETGAADPLARRAFLYDRWMDLYNSADRQSAIGNMKHARAPAYPEA